MIRLSPNARPECWTTIDVSLDGEPQAVRVRYWLLSPVETAQWAAERLRGFSAIRADSPEAIEYLLSELDPAKIGQIRALLMERVLGWDIADADSTETPPATLAVTPENLAAVIDHGAFFKPLFQGLLDASSGAARKNASPG